MYVKHPPATDPHKLFPCEVLKPALHVTPPHARPLNCFDNCLNTTKNYIFYDLDHGSDWKLASQFCVDFFVTAKLKRSAATHGHESGLSGD